MKNKRVKNERDERDEKEITLEDLFNVDKMYRDVYETIALHNELPPPHTVVLLKELYGYDVRENVIAFCDRENKKIWFRNFPPDYVTFAHEILHLIEKKKEMEEYYSYNLSELYVWLAENNIKPRTNPFHLFDLSLDDIQAKIKPVLELVGVKCISELFLTLGILPLPFSVFPMLGIDLPEKEKEKGGSCEAEELFKRYDKNKNVANLYVLNIVSGIRYDFVLALATLILLGFEINEAREKVMR